MAPDIGDITFLEFTELSFPRGISGGHEFFDSIAQPKNGFCTKFFQRWAAIRSLYMPNYCLIKIWITVQRSKY